ncbi:MAG: alkaline phosphatase family protein [Candidatus Hodarchaeota archaeon]
MKNNQKVTLKKTQEAAQTDQFVLIGIDGGCWEIIEPLIEQGKLPNIEKLLREGAYGDLIPESSFSPPSWTTIATGLSTKNHGIYHFTVHLPGMYERILTDFSMVKGHSIWELVESEGKRVGVLKWLFLPQYPKKLVSRRKKRLLALALGPRFILNALRLKAARYVRSSWQKFRFLQENVATDWLIGLASYLLKRDQPYFFALRIRGTDSFQHFFWKYYHADQYDVNPRNLRKYGPAIGEMYQKVDRFIGDLTKIQGRNLMIVSDHGFRGFSREKTQPLVALYMIDHNKLLHELGFLHFAEEKTTIDWKRTQVYSCGEGEFHEFAINLKGRERCGTVSRDDYEGLKEQVKKTLEEIRFKDTGERLFTKISLHNGTPYGQSLKFNFLGEDIQLWNNDSFDILIEGIYECRFQDSSIPEKKVMIGSREYKLGEFLKPRVWSGNHGLRGIFLAHGHDIRSGRIDPISTIDIAPNILFWMRIPIPDSMEGKVQNQVFTDEFIRRNPIRFSKKEKSARPEVVRFTKEEEDKIKQDLKNLGYL